MTNILGYDLSDEAIAAYEETFLKEKEPEPAPVQLPPVPAQPQEAQPQEDKALTDDLERWQKKAINLLNKGEPALCEFTSEAINTKLAEEIKNELRGCKTAEDVRFAFASVAGGEMGIRLLLNAVNRELATITGKA